MSTNDDQADECTAIAAHASIRSHTDGAARKVQVLPPPLLLLPGFLLLLLPLLPLLPRHDLAPHGGDIVAGV